MKKLLVLLFSILISFNSYGEWIEVSKTPADDFYVDIDSIKENNGFVYVWILSDYIKPDSYGDLSGKVLYETKCDVPYKFRGISFHYYKLPMGQGTVESASLVTDWYYGSLGSAREAILNFICN